MIPTTKLQKRIEELAGSLKPLSSYDVKMAHLHAVPHFFKQHKNGNCCCYDCGHQWNMKEHPTRTVCPNCGAKLEKMEVGKKIQKHLSSFMKVVNVEGFQVLRCFIVEARYRKGSPINLWHSEAFQWWFTANGKYVVRSRPKRPFGFYCDAFDYSKPITLKANPNNGNYLIPYYILGNGSLIPELKRNGLRSVKSFLDYSPRWLTETLLTNPMVETLYKSKQWKLLDYCTKSEYSVKRYWDQIKIALRHNYKFTDVGIWFNMLNSLRELGKDINSPKLICPDNLHASHDYWVKRLENHRAKVRRMKNIEIAQQHEAAYQEKKGKFFDILIEDGELEISVIKSVTEMLDEGIAQHHCVFTMGYYEKEKSLILHAKVNGEVMETIEVNLDSLQIVQSRGKFNKATEWHDKIVQLMKNNMNQVEKRLKQTA